MRILLLGLAALLTLLSPADARHRVLLQGNDRLVLLAADGSVEWEMKWGAIHDLHLRDGRFLQVQQGAHAVVEIDMTSREVAWRYDSGTQNGNAGKPVEVHAFQPLGDGRLMIAESGPARIIEVDRDGKVYTTVPLTVNHPHPHTDTRLARKLDNGNYLVCHEGDGAVREYDAQGTVVWEYEVPLFGKEPRDGHGPEAYGNKCFAAVRLPNGNTLITTGNGHSVLEVAPDRKIVWQLQQQDLPQITLAWVTTVQVLTNGNYVIGNCHAGPGQPLLVEIEPQTKRVVWTLDRFADFGNSVSNSLIVE